MQLRFERILDLGRSVIVYALYFDGRLPVAGNEANQVAKAVEGLLKDRGINGRVTLDFSAAHARMSTVNFRVEGVRIAVRNVKFLEASHINAEALNRIGGGLVGEEYDQPLLQRYAQANLNLEYGQHGLLAGLHKVRPA